MILPYTFKGRSGRYAARLLLICSFLPAGPSIGSLFHMADDLGRAMESLVSAMTDERSVELEPARPFWPPPSISSHAFSSQNWIENCLHREYNVYFCEGLRLKQQVQNKYKKKTLKIWVVS